MMSSKKAEIYCLVAIIACIAILYLAGPLGGSRAQQRRAITKTRQKPANFDALAATPVATDSLTGSTTTSDVSGGHLVQVEPRFNVPTFLWADNSGTQRSLPADAASKRSAEIDAARSFLGENAVRYGLAKSDLIAIRASQVHDTGEGAIIVKFKQDIGGLEVFRDEVSVVMNRDLQLVAISGYLTGAGQSDQSAVTSFNLSPESALSAALSDLTGQSIDVSSLQRITQTVTTAAAPVRKAVSRSTTLSAPTATNNDPYLHFNIAANSLANGATPTDEPSRTRPMIFHLPGQYIPAYYVETEVRVPTESIDLVKLKTTQQPDVWSFGYVVSAIDGKVLFRKDLSAEQTFTYRVWADPTTKIPYDSPAGNDAEPKLNPIPDGQQYPFVSPNDIALQNYPFSKNDPWLPSGSTETVGNNADAYVDLTSGDGRNTATPTPTPYDGTSSTGDFRAQITSAGQFLHTHTAGSEPKTAEARQGSLQQMFYDVNFLHDLYYDDGFDEAAGNAQTDNFGRGGVANDNIRAEGQDYSGRNNANMSTPADGGRPRMQMYLFDLDVPLFARINSPAIIAGSYDVGYTTGTPAQTFNISGDVFLPTPNDGCTVGGWSGASGKIALVNYEPTTTNGGCSISTKLTNAINAGSTGFILVFTQSSPDSLATISGTPPPIPVLVFSWNEAAAVKTQIGLGNTVNLTMRRDPAGIDRDGTIDNQIIFHEWSHYLSNRLVGNAAGLGNNTGGGLGEGWSDFNAMVGLTVRENDTSIPSNATWNGAYALATYATSAPGSPPDYLNYGYYFGIRRVPYSTDMTKDPLTFKHIANGNAITGAPVLFGANGSNNAEVHNIGEVWATMLWECYAALLRDTQGASPRLTFAQAQQRMRRYFVASLKATPSSPTLLEARDALLSVALANDTTDFAEFAAAFAKRGAGGGAISPDRNSTTNDGAVESFDVRGNIVFVGASLTDDVTSHDNDGYLDNGETGLLKFTIKNNGTANLAATSSQITADVPGISFPSGNTINLPSVAPFTSQEVSIPVHIEGQTSVIAPQFTITSTDSTVPSPVSGTLQVYANANDLPNASTTDTVETTQTNWTQSDSSSPFKFVRKTETGFNHDWFAPNATQPSDNSLASPTMTVGAAGSINLQFDHTFNFESPNFDGGVLEVNVNNGGWADIGTDGTGYTGTLATGGSNPLEGRQAYCNTGGGHVSITRTYPAGATIQFRFRTGADLNTAAVGWFIDNIAVTGVVGNPFFQLVPDTWSSGPVSLSGRVTTSTGTSISGAIVTLDDGQGNVVTARANNFGYFAFVNVPNNHSYTLSASARRYAFDPQTLNVNAAMTNLTIVAH